MEVESQLPVLLGQSCLDKILEMVQDDNCKRRSIRIDENNIKSLLNSLKEKLLILAEQPMKTWASDEIKSVAKLLIIACEISCNETYQSPLLDDEHLFRNTIGALKSIHSRFKAKSLRDKGIEQNSGENIVATLKKDLVRLVSNLTYNRPHLQLIASQIDAVPLILDLHTYDINNPFIREWAAFATRNLLHNCQENIQIARGLENLNVVSDPFLMDKLNLNLVDGKLVSKLPDQSSS